MLSNFRHRAEQFEEPGTVAVGEDRREQAHSGTISVRQVQMHGLFLGGLVTANFILLAATQQQRRYSANAG